MTVDPKSAPPRPDRPTPDQHSARHLAVLESMERFGGGFVSELARLWYRADASNHARLYATFNDYYDRYEGELPKGGVA